MFWAFVILAVACVVIFGSLIVLRKYWDERWITLAAGSWIGDLAHEEENEKLPAGIYKLSWAPIERS